MKTRDEHVQAFLDAVQDPGAFCEGQIISYAICECGPTWEPNCGVAKECPLFRPCPGSIYRPLRRWSDQAWGSLEHGCRSYQWLQRWHADQQYWLVQFEGHHEQEVQASDTETAVCTAWWEHVCNGEQCDKSLLFEKRYTVREQ